jgi:hypothetical protein
MKKDIRRVRLIEDESASRAFSCCQCSDYWIWGIIRGFCGLLTFRMIRPKNTSYSRGHYDYDE